MWCLIQTPNFQAKIQKWTEFHFISHPIIPIFLPPPRPISPWSFGRRPGSVCPASAPLVSQPLRCGRRTTEPDVVTAPRRSALKSAAAVGRRHSARRSVTSYTSCATVGARRHRRHHRQLHSQTAPAARQLGSRHCHRRPPSAVRCYRLSRLSRAALEARSGAVGGIGGDDGSGRWWQWRMAKGGGARTVPVQSYPTVGRLTSCPAEVKVGSAGRGPLLPVAELDTYPTCCSHILLYRWHLRGSKLDNDPLKDGRNPSDSCGGSLEPLTRILPILVSN